MLPMMRIAGVISHKMAMMGPRASLWSSSMGGIVDAPTMTVPVTSRAAKAIIQRRFCSRFVNISQFLPQGLWFSP